MVNQRQFISNSKENISLRCRVYSTVSPIPRNFTVPTRCSLEDPKGIRYPCVEGLLDHAKVQPYVHDVYVRVKHGRVATTTFRVFFKRHAYLPDNHFLGMQGDVALMKVAARHLTSVVNMRGSDLELADTVAKQ
jgi:hypothetical protein